LGIVLLIRKMRQGEAAHPAERAAERAFAPNSTRLTRVEITEQDASQPAEAASVSAACVRGGRRAPFVCRVMFEHSARGISWRTQ
jgi:hypothetical protein